METPDASESRRAVADAAVVGICTRLFVILSRACGSHNSTHRYQFNLFNAQSAWIDHVDPARAPARARSDRNCSPWPAMPAAKFIAGEHAQIDGAQVVCEFVKQKHSLQVS